MQAHRRTVRAQIMHDQTFMASLGAYTLSSPDVNVHLRWLNGTRCDAAARGRARPPPLTRMRGVHASGVARPGPRDPALVGRLFWSANSSQGANRFFRNKLDASLQRTLLRKGRPPFIDYIKVESLTAGDRLPVFTAGGAVDVSADGTLVRPSTVLTGGRGG